MLYLISPPDVQKKPTIILCDPQHTVTFSLFLFKGDRNYYISSTKMYRSSQTIILLMFSIFPHQAFHLISHKGKKKPEIFFFPITNALIDFSH